MMFRKRSAWMVVSCLTIGLLYVTVGAVLAGDGKFTGPTWNDKDAYNINEVGKLDINVLIDSGMTGGDWTDDKLKEYFQRISSELYDATEKQVQFGKVRVYRGSPEAKEKADLVVSPNIGGAYTYVDVGYFGGPGVFSKIYSKTDALTSSSKATIVHELGHRLFGIYDSYVGWLVDPNDKTRYLQPKSDLTGYEFNTTAYRYDNGHLVPSPDTENTFCDPTKWYDNSKACIMDGPDSGETEFSTPVGTGWVTAHKKPWDKPFTWATAPNGAALNPSFNTTAKIITQQNELNNNESSWETIVKKRPSMKIPIVEPISGNISQHIKFDDSPDDDVEFIMVPAVNELSVCIDRSGSMTGDPLSLAKKAAGLVVSLTHDQYDFTNNSGDTTHVAGDWLSITAFDDNSDLIYSEVGQVGEMIEVNKNNALSSITGISSGGSTSIGAGLNESIGTFDDPNVPKSIILLSDGEENSSPYVADVKPSLKANDISVYTVGLGSADKDLLRNLAQDTKGQFFFANNEYQLPGIFATIYGNLRSDGFLKVVGGILTGLTSQPRYSSLRERHIISPITNWSVSEGNKLLRTQQEMITVDASVGEATFLVTWDKGVGDVTLTDPSGNILSEQNIDMFPDAVYTDEEGYALFRIRNIMPGNWQADISFNEEDVQWELRTYCIDSEIVFDAETEKGEYSYPEPVLITASCGAPQPVIGGTAAAVAVSPSGVETELMLYDDGDPANGDEYANDGIYSTLFNSYVENGVYTVTASFDSAGGTTPGMSEGINIAKGDILTPQPVSSFVRYRQFTFTTVSVPDDLLTQASVYPVYRFYSPGLLKHLYTIDENEKEHLINNASDVWLYEGIAYYAYLPQHLARLEIATVLAVHRFYSEALQTHLFTVHDNEKEHLIANAADVWRYEGVAFYVPASFQEGTVPVYRFYSDMLKVHLYTIDENEKNHLINKASDIWRFEGIAYYVFP